MNVGLLWVNRGRGVGFGLGSLMEGEGMWRLASAWGFLRAMELEKEGTTYFAVGLEVGMRWKRRGRPRRRRDL